MRTLGTFIGAAALTFVVSLFALTGFIFLDNGDNWLTDALGVSMMVMSFLLVTLAFHIVRLYADRGAR